MQESDKGLTTPTSLQAGLGNVQSALPDIISRNRPKAQLREAKSLQHTSEILDEPFADLDHEHLLTKNMAPTTSFPCMLNIFGDTRKLDA